MLKYENHDRNNRHTPWWHIPGAIEFTKEKTDTTQQFLDSHQNQEETAAERQDAGSFPKAHLRWSRGRPWEPTAVPGVPLGPRGTAWPAGRWRAGRGRPGRGSRPPERWGGGGRWGTGPEGGAPRWGRSGGPSVKGRGWDAGEVASWRNRDGRQQERICTKKTWGQNPCLCWGRQLLVHNPHVPSYLLKKRVQQNGAEGSTWSPVEILNPTFSFTSRLQMTKMIKLWWKTSEIPDFLIKCFGEWDKISFCRQWEHPFLNRAKEGGSRYLKTLKIYHRYRFQEHEHWYTETHGSEICTEA